jgi:ketopantoate reductase
VGPDTAILPLLNGMRHLDILDRRFGAGHVLGRSMFDFRNPQRARRDRSPQ